MFNSQSYATPALESNRTIANRITGIVNTNIGYNGYCPVSVVQGRKWIRGSSAYASTYDNTTYYFPSESEKAVFEQSPEKFVPALGGDCIVSFAEGGQRAPGSIHHSAVHDNRIYLFPNDEQKKKFVDNVAQYLNADLAANGYCTVCLVNANQMTKGNSEYLAIHNGMLYLFPSDSERQTFLNSPTLFTSAAIPASATVFDFSAR